MRHVAVDPDLFSSGDLLVSRRMEGFDTYYMVATGGWAAHAAVVMREGKALYVWEARYPAGVARTPMAQWLERARASEAEVAWLQLRNDVRRRFNETLGLAFLHAEEGSFYSPRAVFFGAVDSDDYPFSSDLLPFVIRYLQELDPALFSTVFQDALNTRLGNTSYSTFEDILVATAADGNMTIQSLMALPEQDSLSAHSFSAGSLPTAFYRAAGLFGARVEINAQEFTVKDVYQLDFFNTTGQRQRPQLCQEADPHLPYCQLSGAHRLKLPGLSSVKPYSHMNEACRRERTEGC